MTEPSQYFKGRTVQEQMNEVIGYVDVRAEEVAAAKANDVLEPAEQAKTDAIAAKEAAEDAQEAAEQAVTDAAAVLANAVKKTGESSQGIAGDIIVAGNLTGGTVTVPTPVNNTDAANKKYVDDADALKMNITDINQYAVGLTGNQDNIDGTKTFLVTAYNKYAWLAKRPATSRVDTNTNNWKKAYVITNTASSGRCICFSVVNSRTGIVFVTFLVQANFNTEVTAFGSADTAARIKFTKESNRLIIWVNCYGSTPRDRIMVNCIDGYFLVNFEENTSDIGYTLNTANNTMTGSDGDVINYTSITDVTV